MKRGNMASYEPKPEHKFTFGLWTVGKFFIEWESAICDRGHYTNQAQFPL
jgi:hypothetical protein